MVFLRLFAFAAWAALGKIAERMCQSRKGPMLGTKHRSRVSSRTLRPEPATLAGSRQGLGWIKTLLAHVVAWATTCAAYFRAAGAYEDLARLSDAELERRGLDRSTLGRDACNGRNCNDDH
jgi:hypothetical protein